MYRLTLGCAVFQAELEVNNLWWARRESNPHSVRNTILSRARIPVPPLARRKLTLSGLQGVIVL